MMGTKISTVLTEHLEWLIRHFHIQRTFLLLIIFSGALFSVVIIVQSDPNDVQFLLLAFGEILLPLVAGWVGVGIFLADPCRELIMTSKRPLWTLIFERMELILLSGILSVGTLFFITFMKNREALINDGWKLFLGSIVSLFLFISLGTFFSLLIRQRVAAGLAIFALGMFAFLFRQNILTNYWGVLLYPFLTVYDSENSLWVVNRIMLSLFSLIVLGGILVLSVWKEETLLPRKEEMEEVG